MKIYSSDTITRPEVQEIDKKQSAHIKKLYWLFAASFLLHAASAVGSYFFYISKL